MPEPDTGAPYRIWREGGPADAPFIVCTMFTFDYRAMATRLTVSLEALGLQYAQFQVPTVHRSLSAKGEGDLSLAKPRFIRFLLEQFQKPVLYVDSDVVFRREPKQIASLVRKGCDFAIYNWLADALNDAWRPDTETGFWKFDFQVDMASDSQLMSSGAVQLWRKTHAAMTLLDDWELSLRNHPRSEDDQCLDFAYNHGDRTGLKSCWLTKGYCRHAYWPYAQPVIDHPHFPAPASSQHHPLGSERFDRAQLKRVEKDGPFPRDAMVDARGRQILKLQDGQYVPVRKLTRRLYLTHD
jgi:hypothetical protein